MAGATWFPKKEHPKVLKLNADIERALSPYPRILDPEGLFRSFVRCDVLTLEELPADWETIKWLDHYIGVSQPAANYRWQKQIVLSGPSFGTPCGHPAKRT